MKALTIYEAIKEMRKLSNDNIPFSFEYWSCNTTKKVSSGLKKVKKARLRIGFSSDKSKKSSSLVGYEDVTTGKHGWFYVPLLKSFNNNDLL